MKKFVFSLNSLFDLKKTQKDKIQGEYAAANAVYQAALKKKETLERTQHEKSEEYETKARQGMTVFDMQGYVVYLRELQEQIKLAVRETEKALREAEIKRNELINVHKEIRVLEKLYEKQYSEYLKDIEKSETKAIEDILSYKTADQSDSGVESGG